jgi:CRP-like cAMP-binding protein
LDERQPWYIRNSGFLERVDSRDRDVFLSACPERRFAPGEAIFRVGDLADSLHIIAEGKVKLVRPTMDGHERIVAVCGADDFIGEAFLRESDTYRVDAIALTQVMTCPISREQFRLVAARAPGFALTFTEVLASHLFYCRDQLSATYDPVRVRVTKILIEHAERFGSPPAGGWCLLKTELKHEDIAAIASATRVAVTMAMTELRGLGALRGSRGRYELNLERLQELVEDISAV